MFYEIQQCESLRHITFQECGFGKLSSQLFETAVSHSNIDTLTLYGSEIGTSYLALIASTLRHNDHCMVQNIDSNTNGMDDIDDFVDLLKVIQLKEVSMTAKSYVTSLTLSIILDPITMEYLIGFIPHFTRLRKLSFEVDLYPDYSIALHNIMTDKLILAIQHNICLTELNIEIDWRDPTKSENRIQNYCLRSKALHEIMINQQTVSITSLPHLFQTIGIQWIERCHHHCHGRNAIYHLLLSLEN
jgi:hypothetical protein